MRIQVDSSAANDPEAHAWLDRILYKIEDGWHVWETGPVSALAKIKASTWIASRGQQGDWVRELLVQSVRREAWDAGPHERFMLVTARPIGSDELTAVEAARFAEEPLVILVENRNSDGDFLQRVIAELDKPLDKVWRQPGDPIRLDSLGGVGQMRSEVERLSRKMGLRRRLAVIVDSDRKGPDEVGSKAARDLKSACEALEVPCWMLEKRESENYLPWSLLAERCNAGNEQRQVLEAWNRLTDVQKDFFDMKNGLPDNLTEVEQRLFRGIDHTDRQSLLRGFGRNVWECWKKRGVQVESELRARGQRDLERGLALIRREV